LLQLQERQGYRKWCAARQAGTTGSACRSAGCTRYVGVAPDFW